MLTPGSGPINDEILELGYVVARLLSFWTLHSIHSQRSALSSRGICLVLEERLTQKSEVSPPDQK